MMPLLDAQSPQSCRSVQHDINVFNAERQLHTEQRCPSLKFMFVLFIIISTWALLSARSPDRTSCACPTPALPHRQFFEVMTGARA